jgi:ribosomal protein S18 acetylase RimI-like enzyme
MKQIIPHIRPFQTADLEAVVAILQTNNQLATPAVDGPAALRRVSQLTGAFFLVAEVDNRVVGMVRGVWDGSRALVHQLSVDPGYQRQGIGSALMRALARRFREHGAPSLAVTATEKTSRFYERLGFASTPVVFMIAQDIRTVTGEANA